MNKRIRVFFLLIGIIFSMQGWADIKTSPLTFKAQCNGTGTADDGVTWTVTSDGKESTFDKNRGIHFGAGNAEVGHLTLSTSGIKGKITQIVVNAAGVKGTKAQLGVSVGGTTFGNSTQVTQTPKAYTFTGSAQGEVVVKLSQNKTKKGLYVKSIAVTYDDSNEPSTPNNPKPEEPNEPTPENPKPLDPNTTGNSFIFNTDEGLTSLGITKPIEGKGTDITTDLTLGAVTLSNTKGSTATRVWNSTGKTDLRIYKDATLTISVPEGYSLASIVFSGGPLNLSTTEGTFTKGNWTPGSNPTAKVTFTVSKTTNIQTITVSYVSGLIPPSFSLASGTYEGEQIVSITTPVEGAEIHYTTDGTEPTATSAKYSAPLKICTTQTVKAVSVKDNKISAVSSASYVINYTIKSIADLKKLASGTEVTLSLSDGDEGNMARVIYVNGTGNTQEAFIRDKTGAICFYGINPNVPFEYNQHIAGHICGMYKLENGLPKFCATKNTNTTRLIIAEPITEDDVTPQEIKSDEYDNHVADWVILKDQYIASEDLTTTEGLTIKNQFQLNETNEYADPYKGSIVDVSGIVYPHGTHKFIYPIHIGENQPVTFVIDQSKEFVSPTKDLGPVTVRLNRTLSTKWWNTFCIPFDITDIENATATEFTRQMDGATMKFTPVHSIKAGVPYLIKWDKVNPTFKHVTLKSTPAQTISTNDGAYSFIGTYGITTLKDDKTERFLGDGDKLYWPAASSGAGYNKLQGMRAYYRVPASVTTAKVGFYTPFTTSVGKFVAEKGNQPTIYNLSGQKVSGSLSELKKGIYIVNGQKIIIK